MTTTVNGPEIFNAKQACKYLSISPTSLDTLLKNGDIPYRRVGKRGRFIILKSAVDAYLAGTDRKA